MKSDSQGRAFALADLVMLTAFVLVVLALVSVMLPRQRRAAQLFESMSQMKELHTGYQQYGLDYADAVATFTWRAQVTNNSQWGDLRFASDELSAAANQATDLVRRRFNPSFPLTQSWIPHILYSFLILGDYMDKPLPWRVLASPADSALMQWQSDPTQWAAFGLPAQRWCFSSSYELGTAFWCKDTTNSTNGGAAPASTHNTYTVLQSTSPTTNPAFGTRRLSEVVYPAQKAMIYDRYQRHFGSRVAFFGFQEAKVPIMAADGAAQVRTTELTNRGFNPQNPTALTYATYTYSQLNYEPPVPAGVGSVVFGQYRWTRSGLRGIDFEGAEIPWQ
ncbi:MAG: hypothetical protein KGS45_02310 [Planctomycetes bacterium]|nr:hypothetical protein [Planctomycetota bacterium]